MLGRSMGRGRVDAGVASLRISGRTKNVRGELTADRLDTAAVDRAATRVNIA